MPEPVRIGVAHPRTTPKALEYVLAVTMSEREAQRDDLVRTVSLEPDRERDLLAGTATEVEATPVEQNALGRLAEQLEGYRKNAERQEAWVRALRLPRDGNPEAGDVVDVEFLLPSGDTFTRSFSIPPQTWPDDHEFVRFLEHIGRMPANLTGMLGDPVAVTHDGSEWQLALEEPAEDAQSETVSEPSDLFVNSLVVSIVALLVLSQIMLPITVLLSLPSILWFVPLGFGTIAIAVAIFVLGSSVS